MTTQNLLGAAPFIDARVEFWSNESRWPRETMRHSFLAIVVHELGRLLYRESWTGNEPATVIYFPIRTVHDVATPPSDLQTAAWLLYAHHPGYKLRADAAFTEGKSAPVPTVDEWPIAHALSRQKAEASWAAVKRYWDVCLALTTLFELGLVVAARRDHVYGHPEAIHPSYWINEIYQHWFDTCQIDRDQPFCGIPVRDGGDWIYVDRESYQRWRNASFGTARDNLSHSQGEQSVKSDEGAIPPADTTEPGRTTGSAVPTGTGQAKRRPGAKPSYDWQSFDEEVLRRAKSDDPPSSIHSMADEMLHWCSETWNKEPAKSTTRTRIAKILDENGLSLD